MSNSLQLLKIRNLALESIPNDQGWQILAVQHGGLQRHAHIFSRWLRRHDPTQFGQFTYHLDWHYSQESFVQVLATLRLPDFNRARPQKLILSQSHAATSRSLVFDASSEFSKPCQPIYWSEPTASQWDQWAVGCQACINGQEIWIEICRSQWPFGIQPYGERA